jgi:DNA/RNA-binding domain of Phe-tRNA-synthetase-like protein
MAYYKRFIVENGIEEIGLKGIYFKVEGLTNLEFHPEFEPFVKNEVNKVLGIIEGDGEFFRNDLILQGFRQLHERTGAPNRKNPAAPENLLKTISKHRALPRINLLVDIYNTISIKYRLALGAHDLSAIDGNIHLRFTTGSEKYVPIGSVEPKDVPAHHYSYIDSGNEILCYLDVRQVNKSIVTAQTTDSFYIVQGNAETSPGYIEEAVHELIALTRQYCGGKETILGKVGC